MVSFQSSRSDYKKNAASHLVSAQFYPISSLGSGYKRTVEHLPYVEVVYTQRWHFLRSLQMCQSLAPSEDDSRRDMSHTEITNQRECANTTQILKPMLLKHNVGNRINLIFHQL